MKIRLLGTSGCHLCEEAEMLMGNCLKNETGLTIEFIDIAEQAQWQADYAISIPVLLHEESDRALLWPFTETQIIDFIKFRS